MVRTVIYCCLGFALACATETVGAQELPVAAETGEEGGAVVTREALSAMLADAGTSGDDPEELPPEWGCDFVGAGFCYGCWEEPALGRSYCRIYW
jgi:hypothetical protein